MHLAGWLYSAGTVTPSLFLSHSGPMPQEGPAGGSVAIFAWRMPTCGWIDFTGDAGFGPPVRRVEMWPLPSSVLQVSMGGSWHVGSGTDPQTRPSHASVKQVRPHCRPVVIMSHLAPGNWLFNLPSVPPFPSIPPNAWKDAIKLPHTSLEGFAVQAQ